MGASTKSPYYGASYPQGTPPSAGEKLATLTPQACFADTCVMQHLRILSQRAYILGPSYDLNLYVDYMGI
jgi:hypothetical protein